MRRLVKMLKSHGLVGSKDTIGRYMLKELKWKNWRCLKRPLLTESHKKQWLAFARQYKHWTVDKWSDVMFTDESPFKAFYVPNSRNDTVLGSHEDHVPQADQMKFSPSVMVWGGMTAHGLAKIFTSFRKEPE